MGKVKSIWTAIAAALAMILLILDSKTAFRGAYDAIILCLTTVVPSLFPFLVLSGILTAVLGDKGFSLLRLLGKACRIPQGSEVVLLTGLIGGYPVGAQCISQSYRNGRLSRMDAERMLGFCSNAGPAFIFGMIAPYFQNPAIPWILWVIHIFSALSVGVILPGKATGSFIPRSRKHVTMSTAVTQAVKTMGTVCGWIVIFRVMIAFCERWFLWLMPIEWAVGLRGLAELSNGCVALGAVSSESMRFVLCSCLLAFGGICVWMQTVSVTEELGTGAYLPGKLLHTLISYLLSTAMATVLFPDERSVVSPIPLLLCCAAIPAIILSIKKVVAINKKMLYNDEKSQ